MARHLAVRADVLAVTAIDYVNCHFKRRQDIFDTYRRPDEAKNIAAAKR
jgi:hypothetical protein